MSVKVNGPQIANITDKWELATRMAGNSKAPEQALKSLFKGIISGFEGSSLEQGFRRKTHNRSGSIIFRVLRYNS